MTSPARWRRLIQGAGVRKRRKFHIAGNLILSLSSGCLQMLFSDRKERFFVMANTLFFGELGDHRYGGSTRTGQRRTGERNGENSNDDEGTAVPQN